MGKVNEEPGYWGRLRNYADGAWVESKASETLKVADPATQEMVAEVPLSPSEDVDAAVRAAQAAFEEWRETPPQVRARHFFRLKALLEDHFEAIARALVVENGKTLDEARGSVRRAIDNVEVAAGIPSLMMGYGLEDGAAGGIDEDAIRQPLGVFASVSPFNFPAMVPFWSWPYAVATGNTFIVKPSEQVPTTMNYIFRLIHEAGFPPGVVNLVNGAKVTVDSLLDHRDIQGISFVGSTPVARHIYKRAGETGKRVQCGGGAKNFLVVMPDADLSRTVPNALSSCYGCAGERCLAGSAIVAVGDIHRRLTEHFADAAKRLRVGYGLDEGTEMGPLISRRHLERVVGYVERGEAEGAKLLLDGRGVKVKDYPKGNFLGPTVFDAVDPTMAIAREEIFGPVVSILRAGDLDEAIDMINSSPFGNAASLYTSSGRAAREFRYRVRCGNIGINVGVAAPMAYFPFGGQKASFFGTLHAQGRDAVDFFTDEKVVISRWF